MDPLAQLDTEHGGPNCDCFRCLCWYVNHWVMAVYGDFHDKGLRSGRIKRPIPMMLSSKSTVPVVKRRMLVGLDFLIREAAPLALLAIGELHEPKGRERHSELALELQHLPPIVDARTARQSSSALESARMATCIWDGDPDGNRLSIAWALGDLVIYVDRKSDEIFDEGLERGAAGGFDWLDPSLVLPKFEQVAIRLGDPVDTRSLWEKIILNRPPPQRPTIDETAHKARLHAAALKCIERMLRIR